MYIKLIKIKSKINGYGIFTKNLIPKNTKFYHIPLNIIYTIPTPKCARIADKKYVSDNKILNWVNHSCNPNSKLDINRKNPILTAIRKILPDEEITVDYRKTEKEGKRVICTCGDINCKKFLDYAS
ncbi:SET domain-containing protein-lysine N-methyltransferase [bacterium]|nr:SET domain-containing protein-lysine N-methyltransferase [bacterium]